MENQTGINDFWQVGTVYKHMGYPGIKWRMVGTQEEYVRLESDKVPYYLLTPGSPKPFFIYKYPFQ